MKLKDLLKENVNNVLDFINDNCEKNKDVCVGYLATLMVLRDMGKLLNDESHPLQQHTYIDYLYGSSEQALKAINHFHKRIQQNPRARIIYKKYESQFNDAAYGHEAMRTRIKQIAPYFDSRQKSRTEYYKDQLISNLEVAQQKAIDQHKEQYDLTDGNKIYDDQSRK